MNAKFAGKIVLVTGGGNGIGRACSRAFAAAGARVAVIDRDGAAAQAVAAEIGGNAGGHALDVADGAAFARLAAQIVDAEGGIDVLVNAAGTITRQTVAAMPAADWDRVIAVNLRGPFNGTQAVIPQMRKRGGGQIPSAEQKAERARKIPLGRLVEPEDIAEAVLFLAGDRARICTGIALDVDGGVLISNDIPYEEYFARAR